MDGKFERDAPCLADTVADPLGQNLVVPIAGRQVATRLRYADDRLARAEFLQAEPVIEVALQVERGQIDVRGIVEPGARPQPRGIVLGHCPPWQSHETR